MRGRPSSRGAGRTDESSDASSGGMRLGRLVAVSGTNRVLVEFPGCAGPTVARLAVGVDRSRLKRAIELNEVAVLGFDAGDRFRPLVLALLPRPDEPAPQAEAAPVDVLQVDVDGRRVRLEGQDEIVLQCGKASVTLRRNGKVIIRGT